MMDIPSYGVAVARALTSGGCATRRAAHRRDLPIRFIHDLRIERAVHLLRTTAMSLEAISRKVGYEHPTTPRVLLRERTGKTTSALRGK